jgi:hypothetical protein
MGAFRYLLTLAVVFFAFQGFADEANAAEPIGMLECTVASGVGFVVMSNKALACTFRPEHGRPEYYVGNMRRIGLDVGVTSPGVLTWAVLAVGAVAPRFALAGEYAGAVSELSVGAGLGANALVGGSNKAISLQPFSLNAAFGVSLAAGVGEVTLEPAPPSPIH